MQIKTLAAYLGGNRTAIQRVAQDRSAVAVGALLVLSAAFAREYDAVDLRREPWRLALPFTASLVMSGILFLAVRFGLTPRSLRQRRPATCRPLHDRSARAQHRLVWRTERRRQVGWIALGV